MVKNLWLRALIVFLLFANTAFCLAKCDDIDVIKLDNGHTVVVKEVHTNPIVVIDTWVKTGAINENDKNNGVAHFLEHLFFKGTKERKRGEFESILERKGGTFNAATSKDFTHYYIKIASPYFKTALDLHSDMLMNIAIPEEELKRERKVVQEEIRRAKDNPGRILYENLNGILFKQHPYKRTVLGPEENIENIPRKKIFDFYNKWYKPSNMVTVVVGDVNKNEVLPLIKKKFAYDKVGCKNAKCPVQEIKKYPKEPYITKQTEKIEKGDFNTGRMMIAFKGTDIKNKKDNYALDLAGIILGSGRSSRLYQSIKEKSRLATSISAGSYSMRDDGVFYVSATFEPKNYAKLKNAIIAELHKLVDTKVTKEELERAKNGLERAFIYSNESVGSIAGSIGYDVAVGGDISYYCDYIDDINKVTADDIQKAVKKYIKDERMAISVILPKDADIKPVSNIQSRHKNTVKYKLDNGANLIMDKNDSNEIISFSIFVRGGEFEEPTPGLLSMIAGTLTKGTKNRTALEISQELEKLGIIISPSSDSDYFEISFKSTTEDFDKGFEILEDIIKNPLFLDEYVEKTRHDALEGIKASRDEPSSVAFEEFTGLMYKGHPYGNVGKVYEKTLPKIKRDDMVKFYNKIFDPKNWVISASGNFDKEDLISKFSRFNTKKEAKKVDINKHLTKYKPFSKNQAVFTNRDSETGWMVIGWPTPSIRNQKDFVTLKVINSILGAGMSSRLFVDLREAQGLAYEVSSMYSSNLDKSAFIMYIGTKPENLPHVRKEFLKEIERLKKEPVSKAELEGVKQKIIGRYALAQETNAARAHLFGWFETIGKGYKFNYEYPELVKTVSVQDIMNVSKKYFDKPYVLSVVGPKSSVEDLEKEFKLESKR